MIHHQSQMGKWPSRIGRIEVTLSKRLLRPTALFTWSFCASSQRLSAMWQSGGMVFAAELRAHEERTATAPGTENRSRTSTERADRRKGQGEETLGFRPLLCTAATDEGIRSAAPQTSHTSGFQNFNIIGYSLVYRKRKLPMRSSRVIGHL
jgi:hypothetical protein